jgi:hypothetical protein
MLVTVQSTGMACLCSSVFGDSKLIRCFRDYEQLLDADGHTVGALIGQPKDDTWLSTCKSLHQILLDQQPIYRMKKAHCRGEFKEVNVGASMNSGMQVLLS